MRDLKFILNSKTKVLAFVAHPDDFEDYWGGTVISFLNDNNIDPKNITVIVATDGSNGGRDRFSNSKKLKKTRREEQIQSLSALGIPSANLEMWKFRDGSLDSRNKALQEKVVVAIKEYKPDIIFTHSSETQLLNLFSGTYFVHRDHRELGKTVLDAVYPFSRDLLFYPKHAKIGLTPHIVTKVLLSESSNPNIRVQINSLLSAKVDLFSHHKSQLDSLDSIRNYYLKLHLHSDGNYYEEFRFIEIFN